MSITYRAKLGLDNPILENSLLLRDLGRHYWESCFPNLTDLILDIEVNLGETYLSDIYVYIEMNIELRSDDLERQLYDAIDDNLIPRINNILSSTGKYKLAELLDFCNDDPDKELECFDNQSFTDIAENNGVYPDEDGEYNLNYYIIPQIDWIAEFDRF